MTARKKPAARRRTTKKDEEEPKVEQQKDESPDESTTDTAESSPPVEQTKPEPYQPSHPTLENADLDQHAAEEARQAELQAERDEHNRRTGDGSR